MYSVKDIRKAKRIKASEMARDLNITRQRLYLIENKAISISAELKTEKEYQEEIWKEIKEINKTLPVFKHIKKIEITTEEFAKTTTQKVKRYKELEKIK